MGFNSGFKELKWTLTKYIKTNVQHFTFPIAFQIHSTQGHGIICEPLQLCTVANAVKLIRNYYMYSLLSFLICETRIFF